MAMIEEEVKATSVFRFNLAFTIIGVLVAGILAWAFSLIPDDKDIKIVVGVLGFFNTALYLLTQFNVAGSRSAVVIKSTAWVMFILTSIILALMAFWCETVSYFIITLSLIDLIFVGIALGVARSGQ